MNSVCSKDLQELILRYQEELISAKIAKESADETVSALMKEMNSLRDQSRSKEQSRLELENTLTENMNKLKYVIYSYIDLFFCTCNLKHNLELIYWNV